MSEKANDQAAPTPAAPGAAAAQAVAVPRCNTSRAPQIKQPPAKRPGTPRHRAGTVAMASSVAMLVGDTNAWVLLSQLLYWTRCGRDVIERDGWIHKSAHEWERETGLSWKQQRRARALLIEQGWLEEHLDAMPARLEFRVRLQALIAALAARGGLTADEHGISDLATLREEDRLATLVGRSFVFDTRLSAWMSVPAAVMASRLLGSRMDQIEGNARTEQVSPLLRWSQERWQQETGLTRHQWRTARKDLMRLGLLVERQHNFPRRVDLGVRPVAVSELLALREPVQRVRAGAALMPMPSQGLKAPQPPNVGSPAGAVPYETVWAIPMGRFGYHPDRLAVSPKPSFNDHPDRPTVTTQTAFYPPQLQVNYPPPPQRMHIAWSSAITPWGGGGGKEKAFQEDCVPHAEPRTVAPGSSAPASPKPALTGAESLDVGLNGLVWPAVFTAEDRVAGQKVLLGIEVSLRQTVLDEIDWQSSSKAIRSPVGLLRSLCTKARQGQFEADGAHRIATARRELLQRRQAAEKERVERLATDQEMRSGPTEETLRKLTELRRRLA